MEAINIHDVAYFLAVIAIVTILPAIASYLAIRKIVDQPRSSKNGPKSKAVIRAPDRTLN